jgi:hypothetical protein
MPRSKLLRCRRTDALRVLSDTPQERACVTRVVHPEQFLTHRRDEAEAAAIARRRRRERRRANAPAHGRSP